MNFEKIHGKQLGWKSSLLSKNNFLFKANRMCSTQHNPSAAGMPHSSETTTEKKNRAAKWNSKKIIITRPKVEPYIWVDTFFLRNPNVFYFPKIKRNESSTKERRLKQEEIKRPPYLIYTVYCRFSWFYWKQHPSSCKFKRFLPNFGHSLIRRPLFNIMNRMVMQIFMLKNLKKICEALPKAAFWFVAENRTCSKIRQRFLLALVNNKQIIFSRISSWSKRRASKGRCKEEVFQHEFNTMYLVNFSPYLKTGESPLRLSFCFKFLVAPRFHHFLSPKKEG